MPYTVSTDPSGNRLNQLNALTYTNLNYNNVEPYNLIPKSDSVYVLKNNVGRRVSAYFTPYISPVSLLYPGFLKCDTTPSSINPYTVYITNKLGSICTFNNVDVLDVSASLQPIFTYSYSNVSLPTNSVYGMAFDSSGVIYVSTSEFVRNDAEDIANTICQIYTIQKDGLINKFNISDVSMNFIRGITFDLSNNLYIADQGNNCIVKVKIISSLKGVGSIFVPYSAGLNNPYDVTFDSIGNLYIANTNENNIIKVTPDGTPYVFATGLNVPVSLTFDTQQQILYVTNYGDLFNDGYICSIVNGTVSIYFQTTSFHPYGFHPYGITFDKNSTTLYCTNSEKSDVHNPGNNFLLALIEDVSFPPKVVNCNQISSLAFKTSGDLYCSEYSIHDEVTNDNNFFIYGQIIDVSTNTLYYSHTDDPSLNNPTACVFDSTGNLYVANASANNIIQITGANTGTILPITDVSFNNPSGIAFDNAYDYLYVSNYASNEIVQIKISENSEKYLSISDVSLNKPRGITFDASGNLYVANSGSNTVLQLSDISGNTCVGKVYNASTTLLNNPFSVAIGKDNYLFVSNENDKKICIITNNGSVSESEYTDTYSILLNLTTPSPLAVSPIDDSLYITNVNQYFDLSSFSYSNTVVSVENNVVATQIYNSISNGLYSVLSLTVDDLGNVFVLSDLIDFSYNIIYKVTNKENAVITLQSSTQLSSAKCCAFSPTGLLYILLPGDQTNCILILNVDTNVLSTFTISPDITVGYPQDIVFDLDGNFYIVDLFLDYIMKVVVNGDQFNPTNGTQSDVGPTNIELIAPTRICIDNENENLYILQNDVITSLSLSTQTGNTFIDVPGEPSYSANGICIDASNYLWIMIADPNVGNNNPTLFYRTTYPVNASVTPTATYIENMQPIPQSYDSEVMRYDKYNNALVIALNGTNTIQKNYLCFPFYGLTLGIYDNTLSINDTINTSTNPVTLFNVYNYYVVVEPSTIPANTPSSIIIHFIEPLILPEPTHSYVLVYDETYRVSNVMINNNAIVTAKQIKGSTYPTGVVYDDRFSNIYVPLQNNTISLVKETSTSVGDVDYLFSNYVPASAGLAGPTNIVYDASDNYYVLNTKSTFISQIKFAGGQVIVDNDFYTNINTPIYLTVDLSNNLYLLSGIIPDFIITKIPLIDASGSIVADTSNTSVISLPIGTLYNPFSLTVDEFVPGKNYLYVGQISATGVNQILEVNLTAGPSPITYPVSIANDNLVYPPKFMTNKNDGYLFVCDASSNTISKIAIQTPYSTLTNVEPWVSTCIYCPLGMAFDASGVLYVANAGTNPNNNKVTKIYVDYFEFFNVNLPSAGTYTLDIYDLTTKSFLSGGTFNLTVS